MNQHCSIFDALVNETGGDPEILVRILSNFVLARDVEVLEVLLALGVFFAGDIQDMCNAFFDEIFGLKR